MPTSDGALALTVTIPGNKELRLIRRLTASTVSRNVFAVASGTTAGQAVAFAFSPLITRIYSAEIFGLQGVFLSLLSILTPVSALRYPMAIVVAADERDAADLAQLSMVISFFLSCIVGLILMVAREFTLALLGAEGLGALIWFLPVALLCSAAQDVATSMAARLGRFRQIGVVSVVQAFAINVARVLGGLAMPAAGVLVAITSLAPAVQAALLNVGSQRNSAASLLHRKREATALLYRHRDFPLFRVPTDALNSASQSVPVIMLAALFAPAAAGYYVLTRSVLNLPPNLIGLAIGNVLYTHYADLDRARNALLPVLLRWTIGLLTLAPPIVGLVWFAPAIFAVVFGNEWREAGEYARWTSLWIGIGMATVPAIRIAPVIRSQMLLLVANVVFLVARACAILAAFWCGSDATGAVAAFSLVSAAGNAGLILAIVVATRNYDAKKTDRTP